MADSGRAKPESPVYREPDREITEFPSQREPWAGHESLVSCSHRVGEIPLCLIPCYSLFGKHVSPRLILLCREFIYRLGIFPWGVVHLVLSPRQHDPLHIYPAPPQVWTSQKTPLITAHCLTPWRLACPGLLRSGNRKAGGACSAHTQHGGGALAQSVAWDFAEGKPVEHQAVGGGRSGNCLCFPGSVEPLLEVEASEQKHDAGDGG
jgi:hypothetical protein